ncbi:MAG: exonuclease SbcCD subunit D [Erysipelotrichaceae bacterium]
MKILHTADWHIGKKIANVSMLDEQRHVITQLYQTIKEEAVDVLLIAGDIYDRSIPHPEAVSYLNDILANLINDLNVCVIAIPGNHDAAERLGFGSELFSRLNYHIVSDIEAVKPITVQDAFGPVDFYPIPFAYLSTLRHLFPNAPDKSANGLWKTYLASLPYEDNRRSVSLFHGLVINNSEEELERSDSEVGGVDAVSYTLFDHFNYTALGHLHAPQPVGCKKVRYSGSLLKYSFREEKQKKGMTLVELDGEGNITTKLIEFKIKTDFQTIKDTMANIEAMYSGKDNPNFMRVELLDTTSLHQPFDRLKAIFPKLLEYEKAKDETVLQHDQVVARKNISPLEMFEDFYRSTKQAEPSDEMMSKMKKIIEATQKEMM